MMYESVAYEIFCLVTNGTVELLLSVETQTTSRVLWVPSETRKVPVTAFSKSYVNIFVTKRVLKYRTHQEAEHSCHYVKRAW